MHHFLETARQQLTHAAVSPMRGTEILLAAFAIIILAFVLKESR